MNNAYNKIDSPKELRMKLSDAQTVIIYGAGRITYSILFDMAQSDITLNKIICIVVSDKKYNPDNILGVPVCGLEELNSFIADVILVAAFENNHNAIIEKIQNQISGQVVACSNLLYAQLRKTQNNLSIDIMNSVQNCQNELLRLSNVMDIQLSMIRKMWNLLIKMDGRQRRMELCQNNGIRYYDELLKTSYYPIELKRWYKDKTGRELDLDNPQTYNEKIQWIKLYGITPLMTKLSDKYDVRKWVADKIGERYLVPLLGVWDQFEDIEFNTLPEKFILKCTHGSAMNEIIIDKSKVNFRSLQKKFGIWLDTNYAYTGGLQLQYRDIYPRIIAEEYLENKNGDLYDYKFWCFNGKVHYIMFLSERENGLKMDFYDTNWNHLPFTYDYPNSDREIPKPLNLAEMISISEELAAGFLHVRVDLYQLNDGAIKFGEMTFTSCNGVCNWSDENINLVMGKHIVF